MFLHLSVILFTGGVYTPLGRHPPGQTNPWAESPLGGYPLPPDGMHPTRWNAFLFSCSFQQNVCQIIGWCTPVWGWCLPLGNLGSATDHNFLRMVHQTWTTHGNCFEVSKRKSRNSINSSIG